MRYIDFIVQTVFILLALLCVIFFLIVPSSVTIILIIQLLLGVWQLIGCSLSIIKKSNGYEAKKKYVLIASVYMATIFLSFSVYNENYLSWLNVAYPIWIVLPAWALAFYYYFITYKITFISRRNTNRFLPHLSF